MMIDSSNSVDVIFMDFSKAFDRVTCRMAAPDDPDHVRLGRKWESHGCMNGL